MKLLSVIVFILCLLFPVFAESGEMYEQLSMEGNKIVNVANPTDAQDAATKDYTDSIVSSGASAPGGPNQCIQLNDNGVFSGSAELTYDGTSVIVSNTTPEVRLTAIGDSNAFRIVRTDVSAQANIYNTADRPGDLGNALNFDDSPEFVSLATGNVDPSGAANWTIMGWAISDVSATHNGIAGWYDNAVPGGIFIQQWISGGDRLLVLAGLSTDSASVLVDVTSDYFHYALVYDGTLSGNANRLKLYYNGALQALGFPGVAAIPATLPVLTSSEFRIGDIGNGVLNRHWDGRIDEVVVYSRSLSATAVSDSYKLGNGLYHDITENFPNDGTSQGLDIELLYHMDESAGTNVPDDSGNNLDATTNNMEDADWVLGKVTIPGSDTECQVFQSEDGPGALECGIQTFGDGTGRSVVDGKTIRFNIAGVEVGQIDADGTLTIDNGDSTAQQLILKAAAGASANIQEWQNSAGTPLTFIEPDGEITIDIDSKAIKFGAAQDAIILFNSAGMLIQSDAQNATDYLQLRGGANGIDFNIGAAEQITLTDGVLQPTTDDDIDLGTSSKEFKDLFIDGKAEIDEADVGDGTNETRFAADGTITQAGTARIDWSKYTASSVTIAVGGTDASSIVSNLQTENDGAIFHLDEVAATPGTDMYVEFTSVTAFNWVKIRSNYAGGATHAMGILLYDWVATAWDHKNCAQNEVYNATAQQEVICDQSFFLPSDTTYIGTGGDAGKVRIRFVHPMAGNAAHDIYIDVVALYQ